MKNVFFLKKNYSKKCLVLINMQINSKIDRWKESNKLKP